MFLVARMAHTKEMYPLTSVPPTWMSEPKYRTYLPVNVCKSSKPRYSLSIVAS